MIKEKFDQISNLVITGAANDGSVGCIDVMFYFYMFVIIVIPIS